MEYRSMGNGRHIVSLELGSWDCPRKSESYVVMFGNDAVSALYVFGTTESYKVRLDGGEGSEYRDRIESLEPGLWASVIDKCPEEEETWSLTVLFDDGTITECSGAADSIPEYEILVETLMGMFDGIPEES